MRAEAHPSPHPGGGTALAAPYLQWTGEVLADLLLWEMVEKMRLCAKGSMMFEAHRGH